MYVLHKNVLRPCRLLMKNNVCENFSTCSSFLMGYGV